MLDRSLTRIYALSMKACVNGWEPDPSVDGAHKMVPVTCRDTIKGLEKLVKALSYMVRTGANPIYFGTDSAVLAAAKKLLEPAEDEPNTICREFFLVPVLKFRKDGSSIRIDETVFCAELLAHEGPCISKEGYVRWSYTAKGSESNDSGRSQARN